MTTTAWPGPTHPTGPAGPGPSGPAGPNGPQPSGPTDPAPMPPSPTDGTGSPWPSHPGPSVAQRAVEGALISGRGGKDASAGAASRPVRLRAGRPPLPGAGYPAEPCGASLSARCFNGEPGCRTHPRPVPWCGAARELGGQQPCPIKEPCATGTCAIADDGAPDDFHLPTWPGTAALMASLSRRAD